MKTRVAIAVATILATPAFAHGTLTIKGMTVDGAQERATNYCMVDFRDYGYIDPGKDTQQSTNTLTCEMPRDTAGPIIHYTFFRSGKDVRVAWAFEDESSKFWTQLNDDKVTAAMTGRRWMRF